MATPRRPSPLLESQQTREQTNGRTRAKSGGRPERHRLMRARLALTGTLALAISAALGCSNKPATSAEAQAQAKEIWTTRCASCHGETGAGDGPSSVGLTPAPRSFKDRAWQIQAKDDEIAWIIVEGGASQGMSPRMAANPDLRGQEEVVAAMVALIRGFQ